MQDKCGLPEQELLPLHFAKDEVLRIINPSQSYEKVSISGSLGRIIAAPVISPINIPHADNAAMDGYALASPDIVNDSRFTLNCVGTSWAGRPYQGMCKLGQCIRIFTGAELPGELDTVVMQEETEVEGKMIHFPTNVHPGQNVRKSGEDIAQNTVLIPAKKMLTAPDIGLLAAAGIYEIQVIRPLRIAFFSTGDELINLGQRLKSGQIYDSNRHMLAALLTRPSFHAVDMGVIADNKQLLENTLSNAAVNYDVIITTGGASVGEADFIAEILAKIGRVDFWKIGIKPGKPLAFGKIDACYFFGLPGNPVSVFATFEQLVLPALFKLAGFEPIEKLTIKAQCLDTLKKAHGRREFMRGILMQASPGEFYVKSAGQQGSHILSATSKANCFIVLPSDNEGVKAGEFVNVEPFSTHILSGAPFNTA